MNIDNSQYKNVLKPLAKELRNNSNLSEVILWSKVLKSRKMMNYQFNRQYPMQLKIEEIPPLEKGVRGIKSNSLNVIVDFICRKLKLIIEVDGNSHHSKFEEDIFRYKIHTEQGYTTIRIEDKSVKQDLYNVIKLIESYIIKIEDSIPLPPLKRGN